MIKRTIADKIMGYSKKYPVVTITGPRQSGKTTLCRSLFPEYKYYSLEDIDTRHRALNDPKGFLYECIDTGAVIDEFQRAPELTSYMQRIVDETNREGLFILTGSQNFLFMKNVSQSLAGRTALATLLPFSYEEIYKTELKNINDILYTGFFPRIYDKKLNPTEAMRFYTTLYLERDFRELIDIKNLSVFEIFLKQAAARTGQIMNMSNLANDCGISVNTAKNWLSILEAAHLIYFLRPHYKNFNKRHIKAPKMYFTDTGLACCLIDIREPQHIANHPLRGALFETFIISEFLKRYYNNGQNPPLFFFRDSTGNEVDIIIEKSGQFIPVEIKAGQTINSSFFKGLNFYYKLNSASQGNGIVIYNGQENQHRTDYKIINYASLDSLDIF